MLYAKKMKNFKNIYQINSWFNLNIYLNIYFCTPWASFLKLCLESRLRVCVRTNEEMYVCQKIFRFIKPGFSILIEVDVLSRGFLSVVDFFCIKQDLVPINMDK